MTTKQKKRIICHIYGKRFRRYRTILVHAAEIGCELVMNSRL